MKRRISRRAGGLALAAAFPFLSCQPPDAVDITPDAPVEEALFNGRWPNPQGPTRQVRVKIDREEREITAVESGGDLLFEGDIVVGHVSATRDNEDPETSTHTASLYSVAALGRTWPNGVVPYTVAGSLASPGRVTAAMNMIMQRTPVRFVPRTTQADYVHFDTSTESDVSRSPLGRQGGRQVIRLWPTHGAITVAHEIFHSLGVYHEQQRDDRDNFIVLHPECIIPGAEGNFSVPTGKRLSPFDFNSIMLYSSNAFSNGTCAPLTRPDGTTWNGNRTMLSIHDINGIHLLYGRSLGTIESNDKFGSAVAAGDFDGDDYQDLAVGAPGEAVGNQPASGAVFVYKGTAGGLVPWTVLTQEPGLGVNELGDSFGQALVAGDFNGDGVDDLAVGAPQEAIGDAIGSGAVFLYYGNSNRANNALFGLRANRLLTQGNSGAGADEAGDRFGMTLAAGDFDGDGDDDLAVAAPYETAPGEPAEAGAVFMFKGAATGVSYWKRLTSTGLALSTAGARFGFSLAAGDLDGDGRADLSVGAPGHVNGSAASGAVFVFRGGASANLSTWRFLTQAPLSPNEQSDAFGYSLATGRLTGGDNAMELVVGAPGEFLDRGRIFVFRGTGGAVGPVLASTTTENPLGSVEAGDRFGSAMVIGRLKPIGQQLVVSAPREVVANGAQAGALFLWAGGAAALDPWMVLTEDGLGVNENDDRLGSSMVAANFGNRMVSDLAVGAPGERLDSVSGPVNLPQAGAVFVYRSSGLGMSGIQLITEESGSPLPW